MFTRAHILLCGFYSNYQLIFLLLKRHRAITLSLSSSDKSLRQGWINFRSRMISESTSGNYFLKCVYIFFIYTIIKIYCKYRAINSLASFKSVTHAPMTICICVKFQINIIVLHGFKF